MNLKNSAKYLIIALLILPTYSFALMNAKAAKRATLLNREVNYKQNEEKISKDIDETINASIEDGDCTATWEFPAKAVSNSFDVNEYDKLTKLGYKVKFTVNSIDLYEFKIQWCKQ